MLLTWFTVRIPWIWSYVWNIHVVFIHVPPFFVGFLDELRVVFSCSSEHWFRKETSYFCLGQCTLLCSRYNNYPFCKDFAGSVQSREVWEITDNKIGTINKDHCTTRSTLCTITWSTLGWLGYQLSI